MIKKLCVLTTYYPQEKDPVYAFVGTLIEAMADAGVECHVISPVSYIEKKHKAEARIERTAKGAEIHVYCPRYILFPSRDIFGYQTYRLTVSSLWSAIYKTYKKHVGSCDALYSHFIDAGVNAAWLKKKTGVPAFMAVGESNITMHKLTYEVFRDVLYDGLDGVIAVSSQLRNDLRKNDIVSSTTPVIVAPNGIDTDLFRPMDKKVCREKIGASDKDYIISFVGAFIKRKGFDKLQEAIKKHSSWKCILLGAGEIKVELKEEQVLFNGRVPHDCIPQYIAASDIFVLPTQAEGCCNAIIEAMGCGLPIVSSDRSFNDDILDESCSARIDPDSVDDIERTIEMLEKNITMRRKLAEGAYKKGTELSISNRARKILDFMESQTNEKAAR